MSGGSGEAGTVLTARLVITRTLTEDDDLVTLDGGDDLSLIEVLGLLEMARSIAHERGSNNEH